MADDGNGGEPGSKLAGLDQPVPDYSMPCRRQKTISIQMPFRRSDGHLNLLVEGTGVKRRGGEQGLWPQCGRASPANEWHVRKHGPGRRQWRKVHLAMDPATREIRAVEFTSSQIGDSLLLPDLLAQIPADEPIGTVTADGDLTPGPVTLPSLGMVARPSSPFAGVGRGGKTVPLPRLGTRPGEQPDASVGPTGSG